MPEYMILLDKFNIKSTTLFDNGLRPNANPSYLKMVNCLTQINSIMKNFKHLNNVIQKTSDVQQDDTG